jgi:signal peptidase I
VRRAVLAVLLLVLVALLWLTRLFTSWPETYVGSGPSMEPTVRPGEYFSAWPMPADSALARGMLVIFRFVHEDSVYTVLRRLAGLPGDTVAMREGRAVVNGADMDWPFRILEPRARRSELARVEDLYTWGPIVVPAGSVWLLSDTRDIVGWPDSRFIGPIPRSALIATAGRFLWSSDPRKVLHRLE